MTESTSAPLLPQPETNSASTLSAPFSPVEHASLLAIVAYRLFGLLMLGALISCLITADAVKVILGLVAVVAVVAWVISLADARTPRLSVRDRRPLAPLPPGLRQRRTANAAVAEMVSPVPSKPNTTCLAIAAYMFGLLMLVALISYLITAVPLKSIQGLITAKFTAACDKSNLLGLVAVVAVVAWGLSPAPVRMPTLSVRDRRPIAPLPPGLRQRRAANAAAAEMASREDKLRRQLRHDRRRARRM
jgi:hypothetical protein